MKLTFLDSLVKRLVFSIGISCFILLMSYLVYGASSINLMVICLIAVVVYIPVTLFYAIVSTFFTNEESHEDDEILD